LVAFVDLLLLLLLSLDGDEDDSVFSKVKATSYKSRCPRLTLDNAHSIISSSSDDDASNSAEHDVSDAIPFSIFMGGGSMSNIHGTSVQVISRCMANRGDVVESFMIGLTMK